MYIEDPNLNEIYVEETPCILFDRTSFKGKKRTLLTKEIDGETWYREEVEDVFTDYGNIDYNNMYKKGNILRAPHLNEEQLLWKDIISFPPFDTYVIYRTMHQGQFYHAKIKFLDGFIHQERYHTRDDEQRMYRSIIDAYSEKNNKDIDTYCQVRNLADEYDIPSKMWATFGITYSFGIRDLFEIDRTRFSNEILEEFTRQVFVRYPKLAKIMPQDFFKKEYSDNEKLLFASKILEFKAKHTNGASK